MNKPGNKSEIRNRIKSLRNQMDSAECMEKSRDICNRFVGLDEYIHARDVLAYVSKGNEVNTGFIIESAWRDGKNVYVPKVYGREMHFIKISCYDELERGNFGILEPVSNEWCDVDSGLMIMPGVAFDRDRNRIGFGGGYYDRYLEKHNGIMTAALAYSFQIVESIDSEQTDIKPHIIITETDII